MKLIVENPSVDLIPRPNSKICPKNTQYKGKETGPSAGTCSCEEHCAWDLCRLTIPPGECLQGNKSQWEWDSVKNAWVAQEIQGNNLYIKHTTEIKKVALL